MKCLHGGVFLVVIQTLTLSKTSAGPTKNPVRNGKFMAFTADDMFSDLLDDVHDPLPIGGTGGSAPVKEKQHRMNDTSQSTTTIRPSKINDTKMTKLPIKTEEKIALYNQNTGKFELITTTSGHFSFPMKPVTENGIYVYGGQHYQYRRPAPPPHGGNRTEEIKIFWSTVGDAVENSPYFPIQINVPDMITAMTNFLVNYIPFINRLTNPNHPRLPYPIPQRNFTTDHHHMDYYENYDFDQGNDNSLNRREFVTGVRLEEKSPKEKRKNKRKSNKKKNSQKSASRRIFQRPNFRKTTSPPIEDIKLWHQFGSDQKETVKLKNMPITRKRVRVADREVFNFKNSDISNSPIMILNVPQRPITHYKVSHQELREKEKPERPQKQPLQPAQSQQSQPEQRQIAPANASTKQRRKVRNDTKAKKSSKRSGRSDGDVNKEPETSTKSISKL